MRTRVKVAAIAKDEAAYIPQWIFHHLHFGFDCVEIWLNDTSDPSLEALTRIQAHYGEQLVEFRSADGLLAECKSKNENFQVAAYREIARNAAIAGFTHVLFLDLDELWLPADFTTTVGDFIGRHWDADAISMPWMIDRADVSREPFSQPIQSAISVNKDRHVKTILRLSDRVERIHVHNHEVAGGKYVLSDGRDFRNSDPDQYFRAKVSMSDFIESRECVDAAFVYHAVHRSQLEYLASLLRGRSHANDRYVLKSNRWGFLESDAPVVRVLIDANAVDAYEIKLAAFIDESALSEIIEAARNFITTRAYQVLALLRRQPSIARANYRILRGLKINEYAYLEGGGDLVRHSIDSVAYANGSMEINGWAYNSFSSRRGTISLTDETTLAESVETKYIFRKDVVNLYADAPLECGFHLKIELTERGRARIEESSAPFTLIYTDPSSGSTTPFNFDAVGAGRAISRQGETSVVPLSPVLRPTPEQALLPLRERLANIATFICYGANVALVEAFRAGVPRVVCVETDREVDSALRSTYGQLISLGRFEPIYFNVGQTSEWGYPSDDSRAHAYPQYSTAPWRNRAEGGPYVIVISGRFRVASFLVSLLAAPAGTTIFFDDYIDRDTYWAVERLLLPDALHSRTAEFTVPPQLPMRETLSLLADYCVNPT